MRIYPGPVENPSIFIPAQAKKVRYDTNAKSLSWYQPAAVSRPTASKKKQGWGAEEEEKAK